MKKTFVAMAVVAVLASTHAMAEKTDSDGGWTRQECAVLMTFVEKSLNEMDVRKVPMSETSVWKEFGANPALGRVFKMAESNRLHGQSISDVTMVIGRGCLLNVKGS